MEQHHLLPAQWTPIARFEPTGWRYAEGWAKTLIDAMRDAGQIVTAQKRGDDGRMVLLAHATRGRR